MVYDRNQLHNDWVVEDDEIDILEMDEDQAYYVECENELVKCLELDNQFLDEEDDIIYRNSKISNSIVEMASNAKLNIPKDFKYKKITTNENCHCKKSKLEYDFVKYTGKSNKRNLEEYVYGQLFAILMQTGTCKYIDSTSKIYSWRNYLIGLHRKKVISWCQIRNIDPTKSKLIYEIGDGFTLPEYEDYLERIVYCIKRQKGEL